MKSTALQLTLRRMHRAFTNPKVLGGIGIAAVLLGVSGPFQTFEAFALPARLAYWLLVCALTLAAGFFAGTYVEAALEKRISEWPLFIFSSIATAIAVVATMFLVNLLSARATLHGAESLQLWGYITIVSFAVSAAFKLFGAKQPPKTAALLARLPLEKRGPLISLSVQDHYTEVTTVKGTHLVLIRLSDAMAEAGEGLQIHRSHWVALKAIATVRRKSGMVELTTASGTVLPVSRSFLPAVKAAGLLP